MLLKSVFLFVSRFAYYELNIQWKQNSIVRGIFKDNLQKFAAKVECLFLLREGLLTTKKPNTLALQQFPYLTFTRESYARQHEKMKLR